MEALSISLGWHTTDRPSVLVDRLDEILAFLSECVPCEDINNAHVVDVQLVTRQETTLMLLVEPLIVLQVSRTLQVKAECIQT